LDRKGAFIEFAGYFAKILTFSMAVTLILVLMESFSPLLGGDFLLFVTLAVVWIAFCIREATMDSIIKKIDRFRESKNEWSKGKRDVVAIIISLIMILIYALITVLIAAIMGTDLFVSAVLTLFALLVFSAVDMAVYAFMFS